MKNQEQIQHETIKELLKLAVQSNPNLTSGQKRAAMENIDEAATKADWIMEMLRACGYLK